MVDVVFTACCWKECGELYVPEGATVGYLQAVKERGNCERIVVEVRIERSNVARRDPRQVLSECWKGVWAVVGNIPP